MFAHAVAQCERRSTSPLFSLTMSEHQQGGWNVVGRTYTEEEVQDLTDRVFLLKEKLAAGKMHLAAHLVDDFKRSFDAIRLRPDGKVDPTTVDGRIRASTLALMAMKQREETKKLASLQDLQQRYFDFLFEQFGWLYDGGLKSEVQHPSWVA